MVSLLPFPKVENLVTDGLNWELKNEDLEITKRIGTRNFATKAPLKSLTVMVIYWFLSVNRHFAEIYHL